MLLDSYVLKKGFEELITLTSSSGTAPPPGYLKRVSASMSRLDPLLKTLQVRPSPPEALVQAYLIHIADKSDTNFRKILDLKGVRKADHPHLVELFHAHRASLRNENLPAQSPLLTPLVVQSSGLGGGGGHLGAGIGSLSTAATLSTANLPGRFDAATFGSAIMTAARDGVDRLGTPVLGGGGSNTPVSETVGPSPPPQQLLWAGGAGAAAQGNLNENLRNIGKFFKRDMGGFGMFGSGGKGGDEGGR